MLFCSKCGVKNPENSKFCGNCGSAMEIEYIEKIGSSNIENSLDYEKENIKMQQESLRIQKKQLIEQEKQLSSMAKCPRCGSTSLSGHKKGFGIGKAVIGASTLGPLGLMMGNIGAKKVRITCLNCGKKFKT